MGKRISLLTIHLSFIVILISMLVSRLQGLSLHVTIVPRL